MTPRPLALVVFVVAVSCERPTSAAPRYQIAASGPWAWVLDTQTGEVVGYEVVKAHDSTVALIRIPRSPAEPITARDSEYAALLKKYGIPQRTP